jgi:hypothetical protein
VTSFFIGIENLFFERLLIDSDQVRFCQLACVMGSLTSKPFILLSQDAISFSELVVLLLDSIQFFIDLSAFEFKSSVEIGA